MKTLKAVLQTVRGILLVVLLILTGIFSIFYPNGFYYARGFLVAASLITIFAWLGELAINFALPTEVEEEPGDDFMTELNRCETKNQFVSLYVRAKRDHDPLRMKQVVTSYHNYMRTVHEAENAFEQEDMDTIIPAIKVESPTVPTVQTSKASEVDDISEEECESLLDKYRPGSNMLSMFREASNLDSDKDGEDDFSATVEESHTAEEDDDILTNLKKEVNGTSHKVETIDDSVLRELVSAPVDEDESFKDLFNDNNEDDVEDDEDEQDDEVRSLRNLIEAAKRAVQNSDE